MAKLSPRQLAFANYYIELGNAEQAAIKAGYSGKYARGNAHKLVANNGIKIYIRERMAQKDQSRIASQDEVLEFWTNVVRNLETEEVPVSMTNKFELIDKKPSLKDRIKAAELLGKVHGLFIDKQEVKLSGGVDSKVTFVAEWGSDD